MTTAAAVSEATSEDWYAAEQSKSLMKNIVRRNNNLSTPSSSTTTTTSSEQAAAATERNLGSFYDNFYAARKSRGFTTLKKYAPPSNYQAINSLDSYSEFWIDVTSANFNTQERAGPCVWSECEIDAVDEEYMGDNRDGDEQWYQFRTQQFCANAAFTLYGRKKYENFIGRFGNQCSERHFINSFFTYGGSDNLLKALGQTPTVYYQGDGASSNADCMYSNDGNGYSTLGCSSDGEYIVGFFGGNTCDGNYFTGGDNFNSYNNAFQSAKCQSVDADTVYKLLSISWACDVRLYPNGQCPDVWGRKSFYEYALAVAHEGGNPLMAYHNLIWKDEVRAVSWMLFSISLVVLFVAFSIKTCAIRRKNKHQGMPATDDLGANPTSSSIEIGNTKIELDDGGRTDDLMQKVSDSALDSFTSASASFEVMKAKLGFKSKVESPRTFQGSTDMGYKNPIPEEAAPELEIPSVYVEEAQSEANRLSGSFNETVPESPSAIQNLAIQTFDEIAPETPSAIQTAPETPAVKAQSEVDRLSALLAGSGLATPASTAAASVTTPSTAGFDPFAGLPVAANPVPLELPVADTKSVASVKSETLFKNVTPSGALSVATSVAPSVQTTGLDGSNVAFMASDASPEANVLGDAPATASNADSPAKDLFGMSATTAPSDEVAPVADMLGATEEPRTLEQMISDANKVERRTERKIVVKTSDASPAENMLGDVPATASNADSPSEDLLGMTPSGEGAPVADMLDSAAAAAPSSESAPVADVAEAITETTATEEDTPACDSGDSGDSGDSEDYVKIT